MNKVFFGDCRTIMRDLISQGIKVQMCVTSPPYWGLRNYGCDGQLGLEKTPEEYVTNIVEVFRLVKELLRDDGTLWLNLGDSYASGKGTCFNPGGGSSSFGKERKEAGVHPLDRGNKSTLEMSGLKPKDLVGIPWRVALALRAEGWYLRSDIIWHKPNPMPESVTDRPTKSHEYLFLLAKSQKYFYNAEAIMESSVTCDIRRPYTSEGAWQMDGRPPEQHHGGEPRSHAPGRNSRMFKSRDVQHEKEFDGKHRSADPQTAGRRILLSEKKARDNGAPHDQPFGIMRNRRSVWTIPTSPYPGAHFATFPPKLVEPCILAGSKPGDTILDPFIGSGTTGQVAQDLGRGWIGIELNGKYEPLCRERTRQGGLCF